MIENVNKSAFADDGEVTEPPSSSGAASDESRATATATDPWRAQQQQQAANNSVACCSEADSSELSTTGPDEAVNNSGFDDHFSKFAPLPDSSDYLRKLEKKLAKLRGDSPSSSDEGRRRRRNVLVDALAASRTDQMLDFLSPALAGTAGTANDSRLDDGSTAGDRIDPDSAASRFWRLVAPERAALTTEELRCLLGADELAARHILELTPPPTTTTTTAPVDVADDDGGGGGGDRKDARDGEVKVADGGDGVGGGGGEEEVTSSSDGAVGKKE